MDFASSSSATAPPANREHMFEKVVTPSDVGKLNRLVIPKQHAEKYFPLDSSAGEKGLLLNFDESGGSGKSWRFRYSYWSSSQSYVITKGWSRFVKDKQLFAGDVVSFFRGPADGRFFIDWRRRPSSSSADHHGAPRFQHHPGGFSLHRPIVSLPHHQYQHHPSWCYTIPSVSVSATPLVGPTTTTSPYNYGYGPSLCQFGAGVGPTRFVQTAPLASDKAAAASPKRLRLFGVNMDCHVTSPSSTAPRGGFCDQIPSASSSTQSAAAAALQLRLDLSSSAAVDFLDRGKSSPSPLSFDFGV